MGNLINQPQIYLNHKKHKNWSFSFYKSQKNPCN